MFESYQEIFNQRAVSYHEAMTRYPLARQEEFKQIIQLANIEDGNIIIDIPSGGCYLGNFIDQKIKIISVETSSQFVQNTQPSENNQILVSESIDHLPLLTASVDRIISLAGLHHINDKLSFYQEAYRLLKPGGIFCIADAFQESKVAQFLNIFVNQYNSRGHKGVFLNSYTSQNLEAVNFKVIYNSPISYCWVFNSPQQMANYCQLLFGIDCLDECKIIKGVNDYLGYYVGEETCYLNWELQFIQCLK